MPLLRNELLRLRKGIWGRQGVDLNNWSNGGIGQLNTLRLKRRRKRIGQGARHLSNQYGVVRGRDGCPAKTEPVFAKMCPGDTFCMRQSGVDSMPGIVGEILTQSLTAELGPNVVAFLRVRFGSCHHNQVLLQLAFVIAFHDMERTRPTASESPIVVVLGVLQRRSIHPHQPPHQKYHTWGITVHNIPGNKIPIIHRALEIHDATPKKEVHDVRKGFLTKGDDNHVGNVALCQGLEWVGRQHIIEKVSGCLYRIHILPRLTHGPIYGIRDDNYE
ncbi:hypothetical protein AX14_006631 [Amanita brunnescens Koide BX004]|nr:hypothetical protein AX14_006631 [Amanita brunnescens Koide BX004]